MVEPLTTEELLVVNYLKQFLEVRSVLNFSDSQILKSAIKNTAKDFHDRFIDEHLRLDYIKKARKMLKDYGELMRTEIGPSHWSTFIENYGRENQE